MRGSHPPHRPGGEQDSNIRGFSNERITKFVFALAPDETLALIVFDPRRRPSARITAEAMPCSDVSIRF